MGYSAAAQAECVRLGGLWCTKLFNCMVNNAILFIIFEAFSHADMQFSRCCMFAYSAVHTANT